MRRVFAFVLLVLPLSATVAASRFWDVSNETTPYAEAIASLSDQGIVSGYPDGTFRPERPVNRAEFLKILILAVSADFNPAECHRTRSFPDVALTEWFNDYVCIGRDRGYVHGYPDGTFRPAQTITFVEAAKIMTNAFQLDSRFEMITDGETVPPWFAQYVAALDDHHAIPLSIDSFGHFLTREEMAEMIWRLITNVTDQPSRTYVELSGATAITFRVPEASLKFPIPDDLRDLTYAIQESPYGKDVLFSSRQLIEADQANNGQYCSTAEAPLGIVSVNTSGKVTYIHAQGTCSDVPSVQDLQTKLSPQLQKAVQQATVEASTVRTNTYTNQHDGYSMDLPSGWTAQENVRVDERLKGVLGDVAGTKFSAAQSDQPFVFIAVAPACPDLSGRFSPTSNAIPPRTVTINDRTFSTLFLSDGAAGSVGEDMYYTSRLDATRCLLLATLYFHSTGEALDEPMRSAAKAEIARMNLTISRTIQSMRVIGQ